jgi:hypothetical protein
MDSTARKSIFDMIGEGMKSADDALVTAVATGLIEALVGRAAKDGRWPNDSKALGQLSQAHSGAGNSD